MILANEEAQTRAYQYYVTVCLSFPSTKQFRVAPVATVQWFVCLSVVMMTSKGEWTLLFNLSLCLQAVVIPTQAELLHYMVCGIPKSGTACLIWHRMHTGASDFVLCSYIFTYS